MTSEMDDWGEGMQFIVMFDESHLLSQASVT
jgi:hypothetical protein